MKIGSAAWPATCWGPPASRALEPRHLFSLDRRVHFRAQRVEGNISRVIDEGRHDGAVAPVAMHRDVGEKLVVGLRQTIVWAHMSGLQRPAGVALHDTDTVRTGSIA